MILFDFLLLEKILIYYLVFAFQTAFAPYPTISFIVLYYIIISTEKVDQLSFSGTEPDFRANFNGGILPKNKISEILSNYFQFKLK